VWYILWFCRTSGTVFPSLFEPYNLNHVSVFLRLSCLPSGQPVLAYPSPTYGGLGDGGRRPISAPKCSTRDGGLGDIIWVCRKIRNPPNFTFYLLTPKMLPFSRRRVLGTRQPLHTLLNIYIIIILCKFMYVSYM
jgi:hypothetical protein